MRNIMIFFPHHNRGKKFGEKEHTTTSTKGGSSSSSDDNINTEGAAHDVNATLPPFNKYDYKWYPDDPEAQAWAEMAWGSTGPYDMSPQGIKPRSLPIDVKRFSLFCAVVLGVNNS